MACAKAVKEGLEIAKQNGVDLVAMAVRHHPYGGPVR